MDNLGELLGGLSAEEMAKLRAAAQSMLSGDSGKGKGGSGKDCKPPQNDFSDMITPEMLKKISGIMSAMNKKDSRSELLGALKPHLTPRRKKKADEAMQLMRLMELLPMLQKEFNEQ